MWTAPIRHRAPPDLRVKLTALRRTWNYRRRGQRPEVAAFIAHAAVDGVRNRRTFQGVERFFFMLGYTRSGSTLVGSLLNAHPQMVIAQEIDIFRFLRPGITRNTLFGMVLVRDRQFAAIDRDYHGFDYAVPEGDQGRFTTLRVLGDKHAGRATRRLRDDPHALERLRSLVGVPIRVLHLVRNPFDNIASIARNRDMPLSSAIAIYRKLGIAVDQTMTRLSTDELFEIRYEDLTADPTARLNEICGFIGVPATTDYLNRCATLIDHGGRRSPRQPFLVCGGNRHGGGAHRFPPLSRALLLR